YSGTPLVKKLGIKDGWRIGVIGCPVGYRDLIPGMPAAVAIEDADGDEVEMIQLFATERPGLQKRLPVLLKKSRQDGMIWVSWPKKSARVPTDITEETIREAALPLGLVDTKVCAVSDVWSGLRLVIRKEKRKP